jgi:hypothetical protein
VLIRKIAMLFTAGLKTLCIALSGGLEKYGSSEQFLTI